MRAWNDASAWHWCPSLGIITIAAIGLARGDVREALVATKIDERVQEAKNWHACTETGIIEECHDRSGDGRRCGGSARRCDLASLENGVALLY